MRYRLRTLLIAGTIGPPVLATAWFVFGNAVNRELAAYVFAILAIFAVVLGTLIALAIAMMLLVESIDHAITGEDREL